VKMLVDCSGSMGGDSIEAARRALTAFIAGLTDEDRFSLSRFGSTVEHRSNGLWTLNAQTRIAAQRWVDGLQADLGGTQMEEALVSTFALTGEDITDVLLVTDGEIHAVNSTVKAARESGHRVFVVGIGSSPAEPLLRKLAEATGGACEFVAPGEAVEEAIRRMITRLGGRKVSGLRLAWPEGISPLWQSTCPKALFTGDTLPVFARVPEGVTGSLRLMGMLSGEKTEVCLGEAVLGSLPDGDAALVRMAAALEIRELIAVGQREKALGLSLRHQLVNELTSSLMVLKRAADEKQGDMPDQVIVEQMLPAGWGGAGSVMEDVAFSASTTPGVSNIELFFDIGFSMRSLSAGIMSPSAPLRKRQCDVMASNPPESLYSGNGLSPLKLVRVLRQGSPSTWPDSFAGLGRLGLGASVIDWLELVAGPALGLTEPGVVKVFLSLFTAREMEDVLAGKRQPSGLETDPAKAALWSALNGISAEKWPDCILNLNWAS
jgi:Ca-activated chloride channel family protein